MTAESISELVEQAMEATGQTQCVVEDLAVLVKTSL
jgi:hypothetical protein